MHRAKNPSASTLLVQHMSMDCFFEACGGHRAPTLCQDGIMVLTHDSAEHHAALVCNVQSQIIKVREKGAQLDDMHVPEQYLDGHAFHTYTLTSQDQTVAFQFQHNVCGRQIYAEGTVDAAIFLAQQIAAKAEQKVFNMIDVLEAGAMR